MEHIQTPKVENVKLLNRYNTKSSPVGTLYLTTTHLIFVSNSGNMGNMGNMGRSSSSSEEGEKKKEESKKELWILHMLMHTIEKPLLTTSGSQLRILCSNFLSSTFIIQRDRDAHDIYTSLCLLSKPKTPQDLYCFSYNPKGELRQSTGWFFHDLSSEYQRMGLPNSNWIINNTLNKDYHLCPTYPSILVVPSQAPQHIIEGSAKFRSKGRLPILSYLHGSNNTAIVRCAQPLVGMGGLRSAADETYVDFLRIATPGTGFIHIIDTRPQINAMANKAGGKGYENEKFYENTKFSFKGIDNIHKMRASLEKMINSVINGSSANMNEFLSELSASGWLKHIKAVLDCSVTIANILINENKTVMVHCSDGWDRTSQTCAIASLLLDPYYRTITGFQALIEKDWLSFGHKFEDRCGHINGDPHEVSPIFTQFLDATWQLTKMFPQAFQFNERYLITIHEHVYSNQYGTFFGNCERVRKEFRLSETTYSLWGYVALHHDDFTNPLYDSSYKEILRPEITSQKILFWSGLYCRFEEGAHPREPVIDLLSVTQNHTSSLEDHSRQISQTISSMKHMINTAKAGGAAMKRFLPTNMVSSGSTSGAQSVEPLSTQNISNSDDVDSMERKFTDLKTSLVEKCQSKIFNLILEPTAVLYQPIISSTAFAPVTKSSVASSPTIKTQNHHESSITRELLMSRLNSVAVDWKSWRLSKECSCNAPLDGVVSVKRHCRRCGHVFCLRCIIFKVSLPGHLTEKPVPVCNSCYKLTKSFNQVTINNAQI